MAYINPAAYDLALSWIDTNGTRLEICSAEPANYAGIAAVALGNKTPPNIGAPANGAVNGRRVTIAAITDGSVTATGTATHWALHNGSNTLVASGSLPSSQGVTNGNTFTLPAFDVTIPDAVDA